MMKNEYENGWFYGYAPTETLDDKGNKTLVDSKNVVGRFVDSDVINVVKSEEAERAVYDKCIILETRLLLNALSGPSQDISAQLIRFDKPYRAFSVEATKRFKEAWAAYQKKRKTPVTDKERQALGLTTEKTRVAKPKRG